MQKGNISVQTENIFPIIKQFLYSDQEIFLRELVSNAVDATTKLRVLSSKGESKVELGDLTIQVKADIDARTITISDRGIGMNPEEVEKYLNQVAFSSAQEFIEKYKDESQVIGHFGLGFYSAFMVAAKVEVVTKSHKGGDAVKWTCDGNPEYTLETVEKADRGTDIILHISDDSTEYLVDSKIQGLLDKYCKFLPVEIQFGTKEETVFEGEGEEKTETKVEKPNVVNNPNPLWKKQPSELTDKDYIDFYQELYPYSQEPLFWIHLNIDYPFNLTGVLYFPKVINTMEMQKNKIQLYSNQVYVTDDVSNIVPEFLTLLHGIIDSPDIPLNVSRSYLQSDRNVKRITNHINKKVADKLNDMFKSEREDFEAKWKDIGTFVKYGMLSEDKFYDKATKFALLANVEGKHFTFEEYKETVKGAQTDKHDKVIYLYTNNKIEHYSYIESAKNKGYDVLAFDTVIDNHFIQKLEQKLGDVTFVRVDSDTIDNIVQKDEKRDSVLSEEEQTTVKTLFETEIKATGASITVQPLSPEDHPVVITKPEFMRRMREMTALQGMDMGNMPDSYNVVVNANNPLIADKLTKIEAAEEKTEFVNHLYNLALLNQGMLKGKELTDFINKSLSILK